MLADGIKATVVIPVTNMAGKLAPLKIYSIEAINNGIEIILVHDKRDQGTSDELTQFYLANRHLNKLRFIEGNYGSPGKARNAGISEIRGPYVAFWDSDDLPHISNFVNMIDAMSENDYDVGIGEFSINHQDMIENIKMNFNTFFNGYRDLALKPGLWRFAFRKEITEGIRFTDTLMGEDQVFLASLLATTNKELIFKKNIYQYATNFEGQLTGNTRNVDEIERSLHELEFVVRTIKSDVKFKYAALMYWKMAITLIISKRGLGKVQMLGRIISGLVKLNPRLLIFIVLQFFDLRNYNRLA